MYTRMPHILASVLPLLLRALPDVIGSISNPAAAATAANGVTLSIFDNSAFHGAPAMTKIVPGLAFALEPPSR